MNAERSSFILQRSSFGSTDVQQSTILDPQLDDHGFFQTRMRDFVEEHDPAVLGASLPRPRAGHVHDFVSFEAAASRDGEGALAGVDGEDAAFGAGGVFEAAQSEEKGGAESDPRGVEEPEAARHGCYDTDVTRGEIAQKLLDIVKQEKHVGEELLREETPLAEAGIDSLDSLTILFAIEEQFGISIPDERARAVKTFGDLVDLVEQLAPTA